MRLSQVITRILDGLAGAAGTFLLAICGPILVMGGMMAGQRRPVRRVTLVGQNRRLRLPGRGVPDVDRRSVLHPGRPILARRLTWPARGFWSGLPLSWNLLRGELSLFGPRPLSLQEFHRLKFQFPEDAHAPLVKPGILGLAQLDDSRDPCRGIQQRKLKLDDDYLVRRSLVLHLQILAFSLLDRLPGVSVDS